MCLRVRVLGYGDAHSTHNCTTLTENAAVRRGEVALGWNLHVQFFGLWPWEVVLSRDPRLCSLRNAVHTPNNNNNTNNRLHAAAPLQAHMISGAGRFSGRRRSLPPAEAAGL